MSGLFRYAISAALALAISLSSGSAARAERRVALVIGNATYEHAVALSNTANDARVIGDLLEKVGFDVVNRRSDLGLDDFRQAVQDFAFLSFNADVAVVYYSGHGLAIDGVNYLIPADAKLSSVQDGEEQAVSLDWVLVAAGGARKLSLVILDACHKSPFSPTNEASSEPPTGLVDVKLSVPNTLVAFAAKAGSVCNDGDGPNGPFASALVKYIGQPGLDIRSALEKVRDEVLRATGNRQEPYFYGSLDAENAMLVPPSPGAGVASSANADIDEVLDYRIAQHVGSIEGWRSFLTAHGSGAHAQSAREAIEKLLAAEKAPTPTVTESSNSAFSSAKAASEPVRLPPRSTGMEVAGLVAYAGEVAPMAPPSKGTEVATLAFDAREVTRLARPSKMTEVATPAAEAREEAAPPSARTEVATLAPGAGEVIPPAAPSIGREVRVLPPDEICKSDRERLKRLRDNPSKEEAARFENELSCEELRPQLSRLAESLDYAASSPPDPSAKRNSARAPQWANDCAFEESTLVRLRAQPSTESADQFWRDLHCERLRPQVRLLLESLKGSADSPAACRQETEELDRLRKHPDHREAQTFAQNLTCDALRPQAARLLESLAE